MLRRVNGHVLRRVNGHVLRRVNGHVLRRVNGHVLRRVNGHVLRRVNDHVLRRVNGHVLRRALDFEVEVQRKKWWPNNTWEKLVEKESVKVGLRREDALCRSKWCVRVNQIAAWLRWIWPLTLVGDTTRFYALVSLSCLLFILFVSATNMYLVMASYMY